jgi:hypothetical protein
MLSTELNSLSNYPAPTSPPFRLLFPSFVIFPSGPALSKTHPHTHHAPSLGDLAEDVTESTRRLATHHSPTNGYATASDAWVLAQLREQRAAKFIRSAGEAAYEAAYDTAASSTGGLKYNYSSIVGGSFGYDNAAVANGGFEWDGVRAPIGYAARAITCALTAAGGGLQLGVSR